MMNSGRKALGRRISDKWEVRPLADSVLRLIWQEHQISRAEIARRLKLSPSTVTEIMKDLLLSGFVKEVGIGTSSGGRRPIVLAFQDDARVILGIDIGATHVTVVLTDLRGHVLTKQEQSYPVRTDPLGTQELVRTMCDVCLKSVESGSQRLLCIGIAVPSPVDAMHPNLMSEIVIPAWQGHIKLDRIQNQYGVPIYIENDANMGALGEHRWGAGRGSSDLAYAKISYGIGAGYILKGNIYGGASGIAGEMGHMPIDLHGPVCVCGQKGCLATLVGGFALELKAKELLPKYPESLLVKENPSLYELESAALKGDPLALKVFKETVPYLSRALTGWINLMNPERIVLGGYVARLSEILLDPILQELRRSRLVGSVTSVDVRASDLGSLAEAIGAATLALDQVFDEPYFHQQKQVESKG